MSQYSKELIKKNDILTLSKTLLLKRNDDNQQCMTEAR